MNSKLPRCLATPCHLHSCADYHTCLHRAGGSTIFNGALGAGASRLQEYFTALPGVSPMPPG